MYGDTTIDQNKLPIFKIENQKQFKQHLRLKVSDDVRELENYAIHVRRRPLTVFIFELQRSYNKLYHFQPR